MSNNRLILQIGIVLFIIGSIVAGAWTFTDPNSPILNYTKGFQMGNTSINSTHVVSDKLEISGTNVTAAPCRYGMGGEHSVIVCTDGINTYAINGSTGAVTSGTDAGAIVKTVIDSGVANIKFKEGTFTTSTLWNTTTNLVIEGSGNATKIVRSGNIPVVFNISSDDGVVLKNLYIDAAETTATTGHHAILINESTNTHLNNIVLKNCGKECGWFENSTGIYIDSTDVNSYSIASTYDGFDFLNSNIVRVTNSNFTTGDDAMAVNGVSDFKATNIYSSPAASGAVVHLRTASNTIKNMTGIEVNHVTAQNRPYGFFIQLAQPNIHVNEVLFTSFDIRNATTAGISIDTTGSTNDLGYNWIFSNGIISNKVTHTNGVQHDGIYSVGSTINRTHWNNIIVTNATNYSFLANNLKNSVVSGNIFENSIYGIRVYSNSLGNQIYDNTFRNIGTTVIYTPISTDIYRNNYGAPPYNWGASANTGTATNITAFGAGDTWFNSTKGAQCVALAAGQTSWAFIGNSTLGC